MSTITKSIGTSSRDYSTITLWEADLDNAAVYASGDTAVGECYDDSAFDESVTINGGATVGLASTLLTVAAGHRHDGTPGSGARIVATSGRFITLTGTAGVARAITWLEFNGGGTAHNSSAIQLGGSSGHGAQHVDRTLIHNFSQSSDSSVNGIYSNGFGITLYAINNFIFNIKRNSSFGTAQGISANQMVCHNNSVTDIQLGTGSSTATGINGTATKSNNVVTDCATACFSSSSGQTYNLSSDATAAGTGSLTSKTSANQFVSNTRGSEDLHLKAGADAINAGTDLGTSPVDVNIDINGRDRDAEGDTWDIGAHEYVAAASGNPWHSYAQQ